MTRCTKHVLVAFAAAAIMACAGTNDRAGRDSTADTTPVADQHLAADVSCEMDFTMKGWSAIVSKAEGEGTVTCDNGQTAQVTLEVTGGGLTLGRTQIDDGHGEFSDVADVSEIFGAYAQAEAHAGAVEAASAQALTKGEVSLAITAKGRGWSLGVAGAKFEITRADS